VADRWLVWGREVIDRIKLRGMDIGRISSEKISVHLALLSFYTTCQKIYTGVLASAKI
jgi:hypothetical protein